MGLCLPGAPAGAQNFHLPPIFLILFAQPPTAPSGLTAVISGTQVNLTWTDTSTNETGFKLERRTEGGSYAQIATPPANATSYSDSTISPGVTYYYRIRSTNSAGDSPYSNEALAQSVQMYFVHTDHLNTPRLITNQAGQAVWRMDHGEPFGKELPNENPFRAGQLRLQPEVSRPVFRQGDQPSLQLLPGL